jgi:hypothetical protein
MRRAASSSGDAEQPQLGIGELVEVASMTRSGAAGTSTTARAGPGHGAERDLGIRQW